MTAASTGETDLSYFVISVLFQKQAKRYKYKRMGQTENREPTPEEEMASALASLI